MGSKRLKAIACVGNSRISLADDSRFKDLNRRQYDLLNESLMKVAFDTFGTTLASDLVNVRGGYPTKNWQGGVFEDIEEVNAEALSEKVLIEGVNCFACPVTCGRRSEIREGKWKGRSGEGPEYETTNTFGAMCGVSDMNAITMANYLCNEYGLDTISAGSSVAFAMECFERGILTEEMTGGMEIRFGDTDLIVNLVEMIAKRVGVGDLLAEGTKEMAKILGQGSEHFAMQVKGLELPAYDPRAAKICGLAYVTANRGGDHMSAYIEGPTFVDLPFLLIDESSIKDPLVANPEETRVVIDLENALSIFDAVGGCKFMGILVTAEEYSAIISSATGWDFNVSDFRKSGERIYNLGRALCVREGISREDDRLPPRLMQDALPSGPAEGMVIDHETIELMKDAYYQGRGWDVKTGIPTREKLSELELDFLIGELWGE